MKRYKVEAKVIAINNGNIEFVSTMHYKIEASNEAQALALIRSDLYMEHETSWMKDDVVLHFHDDNKVTVYTLLNAWEMVVQDED